GMPVENARRMSVRFLGYTTLRSVDYLCRASDQGSDVPPAGVELLRVDRPSPDIDDRAAEHAAEKGCTNLRTATYLAWRYARCPSGCYESWEARRAGRLVGFAVLRPVHDLLPQSCTIAELLTRSGDGEALDALVACATARARAHGRRRILAVFPPQAREAGALHDRGFESEPSARTFFRSIGCRLAQPGLTFSEVGQRWWYTLGDFDLV